jgi:hypothetical protein
LRTLGGTDKHRNLSLFATGVWAASVKAPDTGPAFVDAVTVIQISMPGPLLPIVPGQKVEVSRVMVQPEFAPHPDDAYTWATGIRFDRPEPPLISFGFRANDGTQIDASELPAVIERVESIAQRFALLPGP